MVYCLCLHRARSSSVRDVNIRNGLAIVWNFQSNKYYSDDGVTPPYYHFVSYLIQKKRRHLLCVLCSDKTRWGLREYLGKCTANIYLITFKYHWCSHLFSSIIFSQH